MRKADIIANISGKTGMPPADVRVVMQHFFEEIKSSLAAGEPLFMRGFGAFMLKKRAAKVGRNIRLGTALVVPEHHIPCFRPAKEFLASVRNSMPVPDAGSAAVAMLGPGAVAKIENDPATLQGDAC